MGRRALSRVLYSAKETCHFEEPTNRSHPICEMALEHTVETFVQQMLPCAAQIIMYVYITLSLHNTFYV